MDDKLRCFRQFLKAGLNIGQLLFLAIALVLVVVNFDHISGLIERAAYEATDVAIPGVVSLTISPPAGSQKAITDEWLAYYRVRSNRLGISGANFSDFTTCQEYIDLEASGYIDLRGGYIGDGDELMALGDAAELRLRAGDDLRIYTFRVEDRKAWVQKLEEITDVKELKKPLGLEKDECGDMPSEKYTGKYVEASCLLPEWFREEGKPKCDGGRRLKGMFKDSRGSGDEILILDRDMNIIVQLKYWLIRRG